MRVKAEELWPGDDAPAADRIAVGLALSRMLRKADLDAAQTAIAESVSKASDTGAQTAVSMSKLVGAKLKGKAVTKPTNKAIEQTFERYRNQLDVAHGRLVTAKTLTDVLSGADLAMTVGTRTDGLARWAVADSYHGSLEATTKQDPSLRLIWRAERDACLRCLSYQGEITEPGTGYSKPHSFGDHPLPDSTTPPLHPRCRCEQIVWREGTTTGPVDLPTALKREAQRSVLRGWADASGPAKGRAARRLLDQGATAPKSVLAVAERLALKYGV